MFKKCVLNCSHDYWYSTISLISTLVQFQLRTETCHILSCAEAGTTLVKYSTLTAVLSLLTQSHIFVATSGSSSEWVDSLTPYLWRSLVWVNTNSGPTLQIIFFSFFLILLQTCPKLNNSASYLVHQNCCQGLTHSQFCERKITFLSMTSRINSLHD